MNTDPIEQAVNGLLAEVAVSVSVSDWHKVKELSEAVVKLQAENQTALKFISLASEHIGVKPELANKPISSSEPIIKQVQKALKAYDQAKAEALVQAYLANNPNDEDGLKAQHIVLEHRQRERRRRSDQSLGFNTQASTQASTQAPRNTTGRSCNRCTNPLGKNVLTCPKCGESNYETLPISEKISEFLNGLWKFILAIFGLLFVYWLWELGFYDFVF